MFLILAQTLSPSDTLLLAFLSILAAPLVSYGYFRITRKLLFNFGTEEMVEVTDQFDLHDEPNAGDVYVEFRVYEGEIGGLESVLQHYIAAEQAEPYLRRMHAYNLRHGWHCDGAFYIPFLSFWHLHTQLFSVRRQRRRQLRNRQTEAPEKVVNL